MSDSDDLLRELEAESEKALDVAALSLQFEIQQMLSRPGNGRRYRVRKVKYGRKRKDGTRKRIADKESDFHRASAPGEPPAPDTGNLKRSVQVEKTGTLSRRVLVAAEYAEPLEFGHKSDDGKLVAPRPFMRPAMALWEVTHGGDFAAAFGSGGAD